MYITEEAFESFQEKISAAIATRAWEDASFVIETVLSPKNTYDDIYMCSFIYRVCSYYENNFPNHPERVQSLPEMVERWVEKNGGSFGELTGYYTALACMFQRKEDQEKAKTYYEKAELFADKAIESSGICMDYERKAYLYLRFKKYDRIPEILKRMKLLAVDEYDEESCECIEKYYREKSYYIYTF